MSKAKPIIICCYNQIELWQSRKNAKDFYLDSALACEGSERDRYLRVFDDLRNGKDICTDGVSDYEMCKAKNQYLNIPTPDGTRDYYKGKIQFPIW